MRKITTTFFICVSFIYSFSQSSARYSINFTSVWNSTDHGTLPGNAHWSDLVGATHNSSVTFWELGQLASAGIEDVAEIGNNNDFNSEVNAAITAGTANMWLQEPFSPFAAISSATINDVIISSDYPLLTLASMVAPSPDWFVGVNALSILDESNNWRANIVMDMFVYDAGTEDGNSYSTSNPATNPQQPISSRINVAPFNDQKIGTLTVSLQEVLSDDQPDFENDILISSNHTSRNITILNRTNIPISQIELYDMLGKQVMKSTFSEYFNRIELGRNEIANGLYIVKIDLSNKRVLNKKLLLN